MRQPSKPIHCLQSLFAVVSVLFVLVAFAHADDPPAAKKYTLFGEVITVYNGTPDDGVLVSCEDRGRVGTSEAKGIVFLRGHPKQKDMVDGIKVDCVTTENGHYSYTSALGAHKTVMALSFVSGH